MKTYIITCSNGACQVPIFEKGYEKDPAIVAKEAIQEATRNGSDVVLVDTAGRMQVIIEYYLFLLHIYLHTVCEHFVNIITFRGMWSFDCLKRKEAK